MTKIELNPTIDKSTSSELESYTDWSTMHTIPIGSTGGDDRTVEDVDCDMPNSWLCDGGCGRIKYEDDVTKLSCHHVFCLDCLAKQDMAQHTKCRTTTEGKLQLTYVSSDESVVSPLAPAEPSKSARSETAVRQMERRTIEFRCGSEAIRMTMPPDITYGDLLLMLRKVFNVAESKDVYLTWDVKKGDPKTVSELTLDQDTKATTLHIPADRPATLVVAEQKQPAAVEEDQKILQ